MTERLDSYHPTTTHASWREGDPRLLVSRHDEDRSVFPLAEDRVTIGSSEDCVLQLEGAQPLHATIVHDERDEYVLTMHAPGIMNARSPEGAEGERVETLRTGARFMVGDWTLVFNRAEFADHGRPYGGREGGEGARQARQPDRPDYHPSTNTTPPHTD